MPTFGSLRSKLLALILTPVAAAIILVTILAISRATSDQKTAAFGELEQRTTAEALKVDATTGSALDVARAASAVLGSSNSRPDAVNAFKGLLADHNKSIMAVFSSLTRDSFDGKDAAHIGAPGTDKDGTLRPQRDADRGRHDRRRRDRRRRQGRRRLREEAAHRRAGALGLRGHDVRDLPGSGHPQRQGGRLRRHRQHARGPGRADLEDPAEQVGLRLRRLGQGRLRRQPGQEEQRQAQPRRRSPRARTTRR